MGLDIESAFNKNNVFIKINYYAYGNSNELNGVDDFVGIEEFKQVIKTEYPNSYVRPIPTGRGGDGVYQFLIEVIIPSLPLTYVLNSIAGGFIHDAFKALFGKLYLGVKSLTAKNQNPETKQNIEHLISRIKLEFQNTTVFYYCWDNSEFYVDMAETMDFYSCVGALLLVFGFNIQFTAAAMGLGLPSIFVWSVVLLVYALTIGLLCFLFSQSIDQPMPEKISILLGNLKRIFLIPFIRALPLSNGICDECGKGGQLFICYITDSLFDSEKHSFSSMPSEFHLLHESCIYHIESYSEVLNSNSKVKSKIEKYSILDFYNNILPKLDSWSIQHFEHWSKIWGKRTPKHPLKDQIELKKIRLKVEKFIHKAEN